MRRREFIAALGSTAAWPLAARAQQSGKARRIAILSDFSEVEMQPLIAAFRRRLQQLGWADGAVRIETRFGVSGTAPFQVASKALVEMAPDVIVTLGSPALRAVQQETRTIPIIFTFVADPVGQHLVESLARPGANATGFTNFEYSFAGKWLEALKEIEPGIARVMLILNPGNPTHAGFMKVSEGLGPAYGVEIVPAAVRNVSEIESTISGFGSTIGGAIIVLPDGLAVSHRDLTVEATIRSRLPAIFAFRTFTVGGGLMSWGMNFSEIYRQAATYVDRVLKGEKPADLPVQAPTKFDLVINLKTAKALGLTVPPTLLASADEVIE
ncbi:MAG TPA: ABC transporter substrate-binding protein [Bradyrhizobium sp.]|nr:ABC transporter substrate-binding protein [Bradyrhizobium sp.]